MVVTISGLPGSGTSTLARALAAGPRPGPTWTGVRSSAASPRSGTSTSTPSGVLAEGDPAIDLELDARLADRGRAGDVVLESRLAGWIATNEGLDATRVWVACDAEERARRVAGERAPHPSTPAAENARREASEAERYRTYYGIDIADTTPYDLVVDSTTTPPDDLLAAVRAAVRPDRT